MNLPDFLTSAPDGEIRLTGHRIGLYHLIERYKEGDSAEMIALQFPTLPLSLVHKTIAYYLENPSEVDAYVATYSAELKEQERTGRRVDLEEIRKRLQVGEQSVAPGQQTG
jgi:uncharacterized protein (DUF433 family)